jgi:hypothetical protein
VDVVRFLITCAGCLAAGVTRIQTADDTLADDRILIVPLDTFPAKENCYVVGFSRLEKGASDT